VLNAPSLLSLKASSITFHLAGFDAYKRSVRSFNDTAPNGKKEIERRFLDLIDNVAIVYCWIPNPIHEHNFMMKKWKFFPVVQVESLLCEFASERQRQIIFSKLGDVVAEIALRKSVLKDTKKDSL
jgi:hypothetical protein